MARLYTIFHFGYFSVFQCESSREQLGWIETRSLLEDHARTRKWLITIVSKSPK